MHEHRVGAAALRLDRGHRGVHAALARLVGAARDDAARPVAAHDHRSAAQRRVVEHLDGGEERVEVDVQDRRAQRRALVARQPSSATWRKASPWASPTSLPACTARATTAARAHSSSPRSWERCESTAATFASSVVVDVDDDVGVEGAREQQGLDVVRGPGVGEVVGHRRRPAPPRRGRPSRPGGGRGGSRRPPRRTWRSGQGRAPSRGGAAGSPPRSPGASRGRSRPRRRGSPSCSTPASPSAAAASASSPLRRAASAPRSAPGSSVPFAPSASDEQPDLSAELGPRRERPAAGDVGVVGMRVDRERTRGHVAEDLRHLSPSSWARSS